MGTKTIFTVDRETFEIRPYESDQFDLRDCEIV